MPIRCRQLCAVGVRKLHRARWAMHAVLCMLWLLCIGTYEPRSLGLLLPVVVQIWLQLPGAPSSRAVAPKQPALVQVRLGLCGLRMVPQNVIGHEACMLGSEVFTFGTYDGLGPEVQQKPDAPLLTAPTAGARCCAFSPIPAALTLTLRMIGSCGIGGECSCRTAAGTTT